MSFDPIAVGSLNAYVRSLEKQVSWDMKKKSGDVKAHKANLDQWLSGKESTAADPLGALSSSGEQSESDQKLQAIRQKVYNGKRLSGGELGYLSARDPMTYAKARATERERVEYERALKRCRTREEVQRLRLSKLGTSMAACQTIANNPNIPEDKKERLVSEEKGRVEALNNVLRRFVRRGDYHRLPTEVEEHRARHRRDVKRRRPHGSGSESGEYEAEIPVNDADRDPMDDLLSDIHDENGPYSSSSYDEETGDGLDASMSTEAAAFLDAQRTREAMERPAENRDALIEKYKNT